MFTAVTSLTLARVGLRQPLLDQGGARLEELVVRGRHVRRSPRRARATGARAAHRREVEQLERKRLAVAEDPTDVGPKRLKRCRIRPSGPRTVGERDALNGPPAVIDRISHTSLQPWRLPDGPDEAVSALARRLRNATKRHAGATRPSRGLWARPTRPPRRSRHLDGAHDLPSTEVLERASASARRAARLCPGGTPLRGSRSASATLVGSVTSASSFILPLQRGHVSTSKPNVLLRSSAHGR
jgi:hypothetical protein